MIFMKKIIFALMALCMMVSCSEKGSRTLVLYYSQTGSTQAASEEVARLLGADIERFDVTEPYDGTYQQTIMRGQKEMAAGILPEIVPIKADLSKYDTIFLGFPIWYGQPCLPLKALISTIDLSGKKIVPVCTFGSGGLVEATEFLREALPESEIAEGYGVRAARVSAIPEEVESFLAINGYIEGIATAPEAFPAHHECSEEEAEIFREATSSYDFPLGMPSTVSSRGVEGGVEYEFTTLSNTTIYVLSKDGKTEFTRVDR